MSKNRFDEFVKHAIDLALALVLIVATSPLFLLAVLLVTLTSSGPVIYRQTRTGRARRKFVIYKIRTMYHDCERHTGPRWSTENDPRVTPIGRFLRRTHLDENVASVDLELSPEELARLDAAFPPGAASGERYTPEVARWAGR